MQGKTDSREQAQVCEHSGNVQRTGTEDVSDRHISSSGKQRENQSCL